MQRGKKNECKLQFQSKVSEFGSEFVVTRGPELIADEYEGGGGGGGGGGGAVSI